MIERCPWTRPKKSAHLDQAEQYFRSASLAGALAGPLEQYYGVLAYARAAILYLDPRIREAGLRHGHGLKGTISGNLETMSLKVENGTFFELLQATGNVQRLVLPGFSGILGAPPAPQLTFIRLPKPIAGTKFSFLDLIARVPQLRQLYENAFDRQFNCHEGVVQFLIPANAQLRIEIWESVYGLPPVAELRTRIGLPESCARLITQAVSERKIVFEIDTPATGMLPDFVPAIGNEGTVTSCIIEPFAHGWSLSELSTLFAISNSLSNFVRYHPTRWAALVQHEEGDRLLPIVESARKLIQARVPILILREFETAFSSMQ